MDPKETKKEADGKSTERDETQVRDLPSKPLARDEETKVRGGRAGGDDDDLEELEVQR